jgi:hypothetical protein
VVHLILDEVYAVNYEGKVESLFGTALKVIDLHCLRTGIAAAALVAAVLIAPYVARLLPNRIHP